MRGTSDDGPGFRDMFSEIYLLLTDRQKVDDPPVGGVRHMQLGELVLQKSLHDYVKSRSKVHK